MENEDDQAARLEQDPGFHLVITGQLSSVEVPGRMPLPTYGGRACHALASRSKEP